MDGVKLSFREAIIQGIFFIKLFCHLNFWQSPKNDSILLFSL